MANTMGIRGFDVVEFYVGSAKTTAFWFSQAMGLRLTAYRGPETGVKDRVSYLMTGEKLRILVTSPTSADCLEVDSFVHQHGDGVKRMSYLVSDVDHAFNYAVSHGADPVLHPTTHEDANGTVRDASIRVYDDTEIAFVNYDRYRGLFRPGFNEPRITFPAARQATGLIEIDHIVGNVPVGQMDTWQKYFVDAMDFESFIEFGPGDISTQYSALLSKVVRTKDSVIRNPINEPYQGLRKSQIQEFIEEYRGSGIQHIAIRTGDILKTIRSMRENGIDFLRVPSTYYNELRAKKPGIRENIDDLEALGILCDTEDMAGKGYLLQLFTKPIGDRPTFFFEIIQRCDGSEGFGHGNFQALFEAIEREQALRGNL